MALGLDYIAQVLRVCGLPISLDLDYEMIWILIYVLGHGHSTWT